MERLKKQLRPEFLNRIDEVVMFKPLTQDNIRQIVEILFGQLHRTVEASSKIEIDLSDDAKNWLAEKGFDPVFGARPLKRLIQKEVTNKLAEELLSGWISEGSVVEIDLAPDRSGLIFEMNAVNSETSVS